MKTLAFAAASCLALLILLVTASPVAARKSPTGSISVQPGNELRLGGAVSFDWSVQDVGNNNPRIEIDCYQVGALVFASAAPADQPQLLGGAGSQWLTNGGPAECTAILYFWIFHPSQVFVPLASVSFEAGP